MSRAQRFYSRILRMNQKKVLAQRFYSRILRMNREEGAWGVSCQTMGITVLQRRANTKSYPPQYFTSTYYNEVEADSLSNIMARSLSNIFLKGITSLPATRSLSTMASGSFYHHGMRYSTNVTNDPDTHEDFRPTNKLESSDLSAKDVVEKDVKDNPVMIYMKGVPDVPQCGFSSLAVRVLRVYSNILAQVNSFLTTAEVPVSSRNILEDPELKNAVKAFSNWPTFPQIFIKGEFIGGSDIILNMHQSGELKEKLKDFATNQGNSG
ncbi:hypothetical protein HHK36_013989 [Tetracentron sinense]|uniref:Glutaredoxin domain-containing protein n=1 Tax=Tetracentron sinense TaxID=13715 RepID=A0A834Z343_TETSI|nr:hypothetical protein HHK36_013989 [Tetracentron sinense]